VHHFLLARDWQLRECAGPTHPGTPDISPGRLRNCGAIRSCPHHDPGPAAMCLRGCRSWITATKGAALMPAKTKPGHAGEWIEVSAPGRGLPHRGQIIEVLGGPRHEHYRVRWTDDHESI